MRIIDADDQRPPVGGRKQRLRGRLNTRSGSSPSPARCSRSTTAASGIRAAAAVPRTQCTCALASRSRNSASLRQTRLTHPGLANDHHAATAVASASILDRRKLRARDR